MRSSIVLALALLTVGPITHGHAQTAGYYPKGGADTDAEDVSLIQLIANPQAYDNKRVRITGFLHLEFEGNVIYFHNEDFRYRLTKNGLWIDASVNGHDQRADEGRQRPIRHLYGAFRSKDARPYGLE